MSKLFIPFIMAGDPSMEESITHIKVLAESGADKIEVGIPFSDPVADGKVIQAAAKRSLNNGFDIHKFFDKLEKANISVPLVLFTYLNPFFRFGIEEFSKRANRLGFESILLLDLPLRETAEVVAYLDQYKLSLIHLVTPTTSERDLEIISKSSSSFIYYMTRKGVTGVDQEQGNAEFNSTKEIKTKIPVIAGFGIDGPDKAKEVAKDFAGVIIGSAIVKLIQEHPIESERLEALSTFTKQVKNKLGELC